MKMDWLLWALLASVFWGLGPVFAKLGLVKSDPFSALVLRTAGVGIGLFVWGSAARRLTALKAPDLRTCTLLFCEGLAASVIGHFAYFNALHAGRVSSVAPVTASYPLVAMLLAVLLLEEKVSLSRWIGAVLVVAGIFLIQRSP